MKKSPELKKRPVNLELTTISLPVTAYASILHRISGVAMLIAVFILLWMLGASLKSKESFDQLASSLSSPFFKFILWGIASALAYHFIAGLRHLVMDAGIGESLEGGQRGAKIVLGLSVIMIIVLGAGIWLEQQPT